MSWMQIDTAVVTGDGQVGAYIMLSTLVLLYLEPNSASDCICVSIYKLYKSSMIEQTAENSKL